MRQRRRAEARRPRAVAAPERAREVRRLAIADQPRDVAHGDRRLVAQQLRRRGHAPRAQLLLERRVAELGERALHLPRRAGHRARHHRQRQRAAVVARDDHAREQVDPSPGGERVRAHAFSSDGSRRRGTPRACRAPRCPRHARRARAAAPR
jgi:hypothetical protein